MGPNSHLWLCREQTFDLCARLRWEIISITEWHCWPVISQLLPVIGLVTDIGWNRKHLGTAANVGCDYGWLFSKACHYVLNFCWSSSRWCEPPGCPALWHRPNIWGRRQKAEITFGLYTHNCVKYPYLLHHAVLNNIGSKPIDQSI